MDESAFRFPMASRALETSLRCRVIIAVCRQLSPSLVHGIAYFGGVTDAGMLARIMFRIRAFGLVLLCTAAISPGSVAATSAQQSSEQAALSAAAQLSLKDGELLVLRNLTRMSSATSKIGDAVKFEVVKPVTAGGLVVIPEHALASGAIVGVEKKQGRGHGGKLTVKINDVQLITGQSVKLRGQEQRGANAARGRDIAALELQTLGFGVGIIPVILLQRGPDMVFEPGTRFVAYVDGEHILDQATLVRAQDSIPPPRRDIAEVYVYRLGEPKYLDHFRITCGTVFIGSLGRGSYIHMELPPGLYWFRPGKEVRLNKDNPKEFFQLRVEGGRRYYLRLDLDREATLTKGAQLHFDLVDESTGAVEITDMLAPAEEAIETITPKMLPYLQGQVTTKPKTTQ